MTRKLQRLKRAEVPVPQNHAEASGALMLVGVHQRARQRIETEMNERMAALKQDYEKRAAPIARRLNLTSRVCASGVKSIVKNC